MSFQLLLYTYIRRKKQSRKDIIPKDFSSLSEFKKNTLRCLTQNSTNNNLFELSEIFNLFKDSLSFPLIISLWLRSVKRLCMAGGLKDYKHLGFVWICEFYPGRSREGLESSMILFPSISLPRNEQRKKNTESLTFH